MPKLFILVLRGGGVLNFYHYSFLLREGGRAQALPPPIYATDEDAEK